jgi:hypothetical protein
MRLPRVIVEKLSEGIEEVRGFRVMREREMREGRENLRKENGSRGRTIEGERVFREERVEFGERDVRRERREEEFEGEERGRKWRER